MNDVPLRRPCNLSSRLKVLVDRTVKVSKTDILAIILEALLEISLDWFTEVVETEGRNQRVK